MEGSSARSPSTNKRNEEAEPEVVSVGSPINKRIRDGPDAPSVDAPASKKPRVEDREEEEVEIVPTSAGEGDGGEVQLKKFDVEDYVEVEASVDINATIAPANTARDIDPKHCEDLYDMFLTNGFSYAAGRMIFTVRLCDNPSLNKLAVDDIIGDGKVKEGLKCVIVDGLHRRQALIRCKEEEDMEWAQKPVKMILKLRKDGEEMTNMEIISLGILQNNTTSAVRRAFQNLSDRMFTVVSYYRSFMRDYNISDIKAVKMTDIASSIRGASVFRENSEETCRRYARIGRVFVTHPEALDKLKMLDGTQSVSIGASHMDHKVYFDLDKEGVLLFIESLSSYINNEAESSKSRSGGRGTFPGPEFYSHLTEMYDVCRELYVKYGREAKKTFPEFLSSEVPQTKTRMITIRQCFILQARLFQHGKRKHVESNARRIRLLESRVKKAFAGDVGDSGGVADAEEVVSKTQLRDSSARKPTARYEPKTKVTSTKRTSSRKKSSKKKSMAESEEDDDFEVIDLSPEKAPESKDDKQPETPPELAPPQSPKEQEEGLKEAEEEQRLFDDLVPSTFPVGYNAPPSYTGEFSPEWVKALVLPPIVGERILRRNDELVHRQPWLESIHVPPGHRGNVFFDVPYLIVLYRMAWVMACKEELKETKAIQLENGIGGSTPFWQEIEEIYPYALGRGYFIRHREILLQKGYTVMKGFADFSSVPDNLLSVIDGEKAFKHDGEHKNGNVRELFKFFMDYFPGEEKLRKEENRTHWNPIVNTADLEKDARGRDSGKARYSSTRKLLMDEVEQDANKVWAAVSRASLDVWIGQLVALLQLSSDGGEKLFIPKTGGRLLLTGKGCPRQKPHNDFQVRDCSGEKEPGYFIIVSGDEEFPLWVCDYSHHFVYGNIEERKAFAKSTKLRCITVPANSILIAHGYLTHGGAGEKDRVVEWPTMRYHMYLVPESTVLPDAISFAFDSDTVFKVDE